MGRSLWSKWSVDQPGLTGCIPERMYGHHRHSVAATDLPIAFATQSPFTPCEGYEIRARGGATQERRAWISYMGGASRNAGDASSWSVCPALRLSPRSRWHRAGRSGACPALPVPASVAPVCREERQQVDLLTSGLKLYTAAGRGNRLGCGRGESMADEGPITTHAVEALAHGAGAAVVAAVAPRS
jgi:hypothetical protein